VAVPNKERLIVIASNYGQPRNPAWYHNLKVNPSATATLDGVTRVMTARELEGEQRDYWYKRGVDSYPGWVAYRKRTAPHRRIPVIELTPTAESSH
jgi:deazaflavin-dependent oxidoreductase (nitroreductase family)